MEDTEQHELHAELQSFRKRIEHECYLNSKHLIDTLSAELLQQANETKMLKTRLQACQATAGETEKSLTAQLQAERAKLEVVQRKNALELMRLQEEHAATVQVLQVSLDAARNAGQTTAQQSIQQMQDEATRRVRSLHEVHVQCERQLIVLMKTLHDHIALLSKKLMRCSTDSATSDFASEMLSQSSEALNDAQQMAARAALEVDMDVPSTTPEIRTTDSPSTPLEMLAPRNFPRTESRSPNSDLLRADSRSPRVDFVRTESRSPRADLMRAVSSRSVVSRFDDASSPQPESQATLTANELDLLSAKLDVRIRKIQLSSMLPGLSKGSFLMRLHPTQPPQCKFFSLSVSQQQILCTATTYGIVPKQRCKQPFDIDYENTRILHGRAAIDSVHLAAPLSEEQLELCLCITSPKKRLVVMALQREDFVMWSDGLRLLLGKDGTCLETIAERRRLKRQFFAEFGWANLAAE